MRRASRGLTVAGGVFFGTLAAQIAGAQDFPIEPAPAPAATPLVAPAPPRPAAKPAPRRPAPKNAPTTVDPTPEAIAMGPYEEIEFIGPPEPDLRGPGQQPTAGGGTWGPLDMLGDTVAPGTRKELRWKVGESFGGDAVTTPVIVVRGVRPGPRLCLTAAVHGDELNGIEVVRRTANDIRPEELNGTFVGVPIVNLLGFSRATRYLPDRRDLNRFFPGSTNGSAASRIASSFFRGIAVHCDALVDFHTGSFDRANLPQVRGDLTIPSVLEFTRGFGATPVLHSPGSRGMLRLAATDHGIPAVTFEVGAPLRLEPELIDFAAQAVSSLMHRMGMTRSFRMWAEPQATFYESKWVRVDHGGMLFSAVALGDRVRDGQRLGKVIDPVQNEEHEIDSPFRGRVIGLALNQVVLPGFAVYHIGIETTEEEAVEEAAQPPTTDGLELLEGDEMGPPGSEGGAARDARSPDDDADAPPRSERATEPRAEDDPEATPPEEDDGSGE
jgi:uncharacterized protein